jgi:drug/metabolite transporter (DMT)-like permease
MADGLVYGLAAAVLWGLTDICAALASRRVGGLATAALAQLTSLAGLYAYALVADGRLDFASPVAPGAIAVGLVAALSYLTFYVALRLGPMAVVSPVGSAYGAVAVVLAVLVLGESLTGAQALGTCLATLGVLMVSVVVDGRRSTRFVGPGIPFVVVALLAWGAMTVGVAALVRGVPLLPVLLILRTTSMAAIWSVVIVRALVVDRRLPRPRLPPRVALGFALLAGCLDISGYVAYATGLKVSLAWLVGLSSSFGPAVAFLFAVAFLGDRLRPVQWLGLGALGLGVVLVGLP